MISAVYTVGYSSTPAIITGPQAFRLSGYGQEGQLPGQSDADKSIEGFRVS
jgi:hypothetical protein